jgi:hypothetical protein
MTITVSFDEIKQYENALDAWYADRANHVLATFIYNSHGGDQFGTRLDYDSVAYKTEFDKWEKDHPKPVLLPII